MAVGALAGIQAAQGLIGGAAKVRANREEARILSSNAERFEEMAQAAEINSSRKSRLTSMQGMELAQEQVGGFAKAGVDLSGSALNKLAQTRTRLADELFAIRLQGQNDARVSRDRANQALREANRLESTESTFLTFLGGASPGVTGALRTAAPLFK